MYLHLLAFIYRHCIHLKVHISFCITPDFERYDSKIESSAVSTEHVRQNQRVDIFFSLKFILKFPKNFHNQRLAVTLDILL